MKSQNDSIKNNGTKVEELVFALTGYKEPEIEIKAIDTKHTDKNASLNQVRAQEYKVIVVYSMLGEDCFVIPPKHIMKCALNKSRGQHGDNSLETITLTIRNAAGKIDKNIEQYLCKKSDLKDRIFQHLQEPNIDKIRNDIHLISNKVYTGTLSNIIAQTKADVKDIFIGYHPEMKE